MAVWDEEWEAREDSVWCPAKRATVAFGPMAAEDAKLAAAAPAMARLLLRLEWEDHDEQPSRCPHCRGLEPYLAFDDPDGIPTGGHTTDCAWLAVMRAAGVRE